MESSLLDSYIHDFLRTDQTDNDLLKDIEDRSWYGLICLYLRNCSRRYRYNAETSRKIITHLHENSSKLKINQGVDHNWSTDPITTACFYGEETIMDCLIDLGYAVHSNVLHSIALNGTMEKHLGRIIDEGMNVNSLDSIGRTPLDISFNLGGRSDQIKLLVSKGGKVNFSYDRIDSKSICKGFDILMNEDLFIEIYDTLRNVYGMTSDIVRIITDYHTFEGMCESSILKLIQLNNVYVT